MMNNYYLNPGIIIDTRNMTDASVPSVIHRAFTHGVNSFVASPVIAGYLAERYDRNHYNLYDSISLIDVQYGSQVRTAVTEKLQLCNTDHLDYYYLDDVCEGTILSSEKRDLADIINTLSELVRNGVIRHLGFGFAGTNATLTDFLRLYGDQFSFCVIQLNYMDWFLQKAWEKVRTLRDFPMVIIGRNPLRDGMLRDIKPEYLADLVGPSRQNSDPLEWAYHWFQRDKKADFVIAEPLDEDELNKTLAICMHDDPLDANEEATAYYTAGRIRRIEESIYCSGCGHCQGQCPAGLNVAYLMQLLVDMQVRCTDTLVRQYRALPDHMKASACTMCGQCYDFCKKIYSIPHCMAELTSLTE